MPETGLHADDQKPSKNRILVHDQGGFVFQPAGALKEAPLGCILACVEDMNQGPNAEIGPIDIFNTLGHTRKS